MADLYLGDIGITFNIDTESTMTSASTIRVYFKLPDSATQYWACTTHASEVTYVTFTATSTQFTSTEPPGTWEGQIYAILGAASSIKLHGAPFYVEVGAAIE